MENKRVYKRTSVTTTLEASKNRLRAYYLANPFTPYKKAASNLNWSLKKLEYIRNLMSDEFSHGLVLTSQVTIPKV